MISSKIQPLDATPPSHKLRDKDDASDQQQHMNQATTDIGEQSNQPQHE
jgi:hypothetical protein